MCDVGPHRGGRAKKKGERERERESASKKNRQLYDASSSPPNAERLTTAAAGKTFAAGRAADAAWGWQLAGRRHCATQTAPRSGVRLNDRCPPQRPAWDKTRRGRFSARLSQAMGRTLPLRRRLATWATASTVTMALRGCSEKKKL